MAQQPTDTAPDAKPPVVLDYASTVAKTSVSNYQRLMVVIVGAVITAPFFLVISSSFLDAYWPWLAMAGIALLLLGVVLFFSAGHGAKLMRGREFALTGILISSMGAATMCGSVLFRSYTTNCSWGTPRTICARNMRAVGQALYVCALDDPDGAFPDDLYTTVTENQTTHKMLICPNDESGNISYKYIPGYGVSSDPTQIILYEKPSNHGGEGGNVLYQDGHVAFIKSPQFEQLIDAITLPDGSPYTPDED